MAERLLCKQLDEGSNPSFSTSEGLTATVRKMAHRGELWPDGAKLAPICFLVPFGGKRPLGNQRALSAIVTVAELE